MLAVLLLVAGGNRAGAQAITSVSAGGPYTGVVGVPVSFVGSAFAASGAGIVSYAWAFGDGTSGTGPSVQHTYTAAGAYNVTLTVTDANGGITSASTSATIGAQAPPCSGITAGISTSQACASTVLCGSPGASLFGTGCFNPTACTTIVGSGTPVFVSCGAAAQFIQVSAGGPYSGNAQQPLRMSGSGSFDPSSSCPLPPVTVNGRLTCPSTGAVILPGAAPSNYRWNFGDGQIDFGQTVSHTYEAAGTYTVALTVGFADGSLGSDETSATIAAPLPARSVSLFSGCNNVILTLPDGTPIATVAASIVGGPVVSIWKQTGAMSFAGWFPGATAPSDLSSVHRLDAVFICTQAAGALTQPGA